jgi:diguanylate cyclase (GGDEF)-like protein
MHELDTLATHDPVSNLYSSQTFARLGIREFENALRTGEPISLLMVDIHQYNEISARYGRAYSGQIIAEVASLVKYRLRRSDIIGYLREGRACILLPSTNQNGAENIAEMLRREVSFRSFEAPDRIFYLSLDIGVAALNPAVHTSLESLITSADEALAAAKTKPHYRVNAV